jgi:hypothetical protein
MGIAMKALMGDSETLSYCGPIARARSPVCARYFAEALSATDKNSFGRHFSY